jgi:hypothetical protein
LGPQKLTVTAKTNFGSLEPGASHCFCPSHFTRYFVFESFPDAASKESGLAFAMVVVLLLYSTVSNIILLILTHWSLTGSEKNENRS